MTMPHRQCIGEDGIQTIGKINLPVVEFNLSDDNEESCRRQILNSLKEFGIFALSNTPTINFDNMEVYTKWFFYLPPHLKRKLSRKINLISEPNFRVGYFRVRSRYNSEVYDEVYSLESGTILTDNIWPDAPGREEFKVFIRDSFSSLQAIAKTLRQLILSDIDPNLNSCDDVSGNPRMSLIRDASTEKPAHHTHLSRTSSLETDPSIREQQLESFDDPVCTHSCCDTIVDECADLNDFFIHIILPLDNNEVRWVRGPDGNWSEIVYPPKSLLVCVGNYLSKSTELMPIEQRSADYMTESYSLSFMF